MIPETPQASQFKQQLREVLLRETQNSRAIKVTKNSNIYNCGDRNELVYFITNGQVKLVMISPEGKECIIAIHTRGDLFGELCLSGSPLCRDTAITMENSELKGIHRDQFLLILSREKLLEGFIKYLAVRIADQQQVITNLVTVDSEQRLGETLLQLARTLGKKDPRNIRIELRISHEELSNMVGTTRPRISLFMQRFHHLGLIETNEDHFLIIKAEKLTEYLSQLR
jgi:CRP/FNR family transcriptional regulator, cyclic AMP receptor protein